MANNDRLWFNLEELPNLLKLIELDDINMLLGTRIPKLGLVDRSLVLGGNKEANKSLSFFKRDEIIWFKDHGAGNAGNVLHLLQQIRGLSFNEAVISLANQVGYGKIFTDAYKQRNSFRPVVKPLDSEHYKARIEAINKSAEEDKIKEQKKLELARSIYDSSKKDKFEGEHYLKRKGFGHYGSLNGLVRQAFDSYYKCNYLAFPMYDLLSGEFKGIQKLFDTKQGDNDKRFLGSQDMACTPIYYNAKDKLWTSSIPKDYSGVIVLAEGVATCLSSINATYSGQNNVAGIVAFNSGNIPKVIDKLIDIYPAANFIIAMDRDGLMINNKSIADIKKMEIDLKKRYEVLNGDKYKAKDQEHLSKLKTMLDHEILKYYDAYIGCHSPIEHEVRESFRRNRVLNERCIYIIPDVPQRFDKQHIVFEDGIFKTAPKPCYLTDFNDFHKFKLDDGYDLHQSVIVPSNQFQDMVPPSLRTPTFKSVFNSSSEYEKFIADSSLCYLHFSNSLALACSRKTLLSFARECEESITKGSNLLPQAVLKEKFELIIDKFVPEYNKSFVETFGNKLIDKGYVALEIQYNQDKGKGKPVKFSETLFCPNAKGLTYKKPDIKKSLLEFNTRGLEK